MSPSGMAPAVSAGTSKAFARFCRIHADAGLRAALGYLGAFTGWRCVAVVRMVNDEPQAIAYFDRDRPEHQRPDVWLDSVRASCFLQARDGCVREARVMAGAGTLALETERPSGICRCVPVIDRDGKLHASLCVFDDACGRAVEIDLALLVQVAARLASDAGAALRVRPSQQQAWPAGWQSAAGEEDPGSALDELPHPLAHPTRG